MLVVIEIAGKSHVLLGDVLDLLRIREDVLIRSHSRGSMLLADEVNANHVINWFLQNSTIEMKVRKALGADAEVFEQADGFRDFIFRHLGVKEGQKWVIEQLPGERYMALRKAMAQEIKAYNMKEDILGAESDRIMRVVSIGQDIPIERIDFSHAIQYM